MNTIGMRLAPGRTGDPYEIGTDGPGEDWFGPYVEGRLSVHTYRGDVSKDWNESKREFGGDTMSEHFKIELVPVRTVARRKAHAVKKHTRRLSRYVKGDGVFVTTVTVSRHKRKEKRSGA